MTRPFSPSSVTATISATSTSATTTLANSSAFTGAETVLVTNAGPDIAFFRLGVGSQTAVVTDVPILPFTALIVTRHSATYAGAVCNATETATLYFTPGVGG